MPSILSKNCMMEGEVEWYCLACSALLPAAEDTLHHIHTAEHKHNLTELTYADNYSDDYIKKGRGVYYCEVCNVTFPTAAKVGLHVTHATHVAAKTRRQLKRAGTAIVFQENTLITESAWNGLVDDTCVLCNVEFDDQSAHKSQQNHILNRINSSVTATAGNIYRMIDDGYQCLTCNKVVPGNMITEHLDSTQHKSAFLTYDGNKNGVNDVKNDDVGDKGSIDGDTITGTTSHTPDDKTLHTSPVLKKNKKKAACSSDVKQVETLAKQHGLFRNKGEHVVYCSVCSTQFTATLDSINEHVDGKKHQRNLAKQCQSKETKKVEEKKKIKKIPVTTFISNIQETRDALTQEMYFVINNTYFVYFHKYLGLTMKNNRIICLFCDARLTEDSLCEHVLSSSHINAMDNSFVITSLKGEFVREVRRDLYHCGYCGSVENDLEHMLYHLDTEEHNRCKAELNICLQIFKTHQKSMSCSIM